VPAERLAVGLLVTSALCAQESTWRDPSKHRVQFVTVEDACDSKCSTGADRASPWYC